MRRARIGAELVGERAGTERARGRGAEEGSDLGQRLGVELVGAVVLQQQVARVFLLCNAAKYIGGGSGVHHGEVWGRGNEV